MGPAIHGDLTKKEFNNHGKAAPLPVWVEFEDPDGNWEWDMQPATLSRAAVFIFSFGNMALCNFRIFSMISCLLGF